MKFPITNYKCQINVKYQINEYELRNTSTFCNPCESVSVSANIRVFAEGKKEVVWQKENWEM